MGKHNIILTIVNLQSKVFMTLRKYAFENIVEKGGHVGNLHLLHNVSYTIRELKRTLYPF